MSEANDNDARIDLDVCTYCGVLCDSVDHVVPRHLLNRAAVAGIDLQALFRLRSWVVPSCRECNSMISGKFFRTIAERREYAHSALRKKYRSELRTPDWSDRELGELSDRLRMDVIVSIAKRDIVRRRLAWRGTKGVEVSLTFGEDMTNLVGVIDRKAG
jgi:hypothetical protein